MTRLPPELWPIVCGLATSRPWPPQGDADVAAFFDFANRQKLLPFLMEDDELPQQVIAAKPRFRALYALNRRRYELNRASTLELLRVLGPDSFLFYKGSDYRHRVYDRPEQRSMNDIDLHIPWAQVPAAMRRLEAAGYPRKYSYHAAFSPGHYEVSVVVGDVLVEIHRSFSQRVRAAVDYDGLWARRERFERDGISGSRMSPVDAILAHAFHLAKDEYSSELVRYLDFYLLLLRHEGELDTCVARAKDWQIERPLFGALHLTAAMFAELKTPAITSAMNALLDPSIRQYLADQILPDPTVEPSGWVSGRRIQVRRKFALMDRRWRKLAFVLYLAYAKVGGLMLEWRARKGGLNVPSRAKFQSHRDSIR